MNTLTNTIISSISTLFLIFLVTSNHGFPVEESDSLNIPQSLDMDNDNGIIVIDDMILTVSSKAGLINKQSRWPDKTVIYNIDTTFTTREIDTIHGAMSEIENKTCIRFKLRTKEATYVQIVKGARNSGCSSYVGRVPASYQPQKLNLQSYGCIRHGTIVHELIHAIGFEHEQCRSDRDSYVTINLKNVRKGYESAFTKYTSRRITSFGVPYDFESIMHYGAYDFSSNGQPTIVPKVSNVTIGQRWRMSSNDALKINKMYGC